MAKTKTSHVLLCAPRRGSGSMKYLVNEAWWALRAAPDLPPGNLTFVDQPWKTSGALRKAKTPPQVLPLGDFILQLVVTNELAQELGAIEGVTTRPAELRDEKGSVAD